MTIVLRLKAPSHFRVRAIEWLVSGVLVSWGLILAGHADVIGRVQFAELARIGPQRFWSACCLAAGLARLGALFVNGAWRRSPYVRMVLALGSGLFWLQISLGFVASGVTTLGLAACPWFCIADLYSVGMAAFDAGALKPKDARLDGAR